MNAHEGLRILSKKVLDEGRQISLLMAPDKQEVTDRNTAHAKILVDEIINASARLLERDPEMRSTALQTACLVVAESLKHLADLAQQAKGEDVGN